jgi:predicted glycoside hydrolase/deacetylase ChbG (UPF0249 family)
LKRLVVTADDAGLHPGMTAGALAAHRRGIVTAVAVAPVGEAFEDAVERLRDAPGLEVGIHWVLVGERPLSPAREVPSLLGRDGALLPSFRAFVRRYFLGGIDLAQIEREMRRQLERLLATGLPVVHANSHQHLHALPAIFAVACRLAEEHGIRWLRVPREPRAPLHTRRGIEMCVLNAFGRRAKRRLPPSGRVTALEATAGLTVAGHLTVERLQQELLLVRGSTELVCHPGVGDGDLAARYRWGYCWEAETAALCDSRLPVWLREAGIELTSFSRLTS